MTLDKIKPEKFTDHFFKLGTPFFPVYLSLGDDAMLIEGGTGGITTLILEQLKDLGVNPERIKYLTLTHSHSDHIGLIPHLIPKWKNIKVCATSKASELLKNEETIRQFLEMDAFIAERLKSIGETSDLAPETDKYEFNVDIVIDEGDEMDLGSGIKWKILRIAGHSPCQIALHEEKEKTFVVGDAAGLYFPHADKFWPEYFMSLEQYTNSIRRLAEYPAERIGLSHFGVIQGDTREFLRKSLKATEAYHNEMMERTNSGEDPNVIANEKAKWVLTYHNYMSFEITEQMSRLLIRRSQKDADKPGLFAGI
jgi:glyoxylase-like metal-dependent hydrolase (beta-lactamase superfamily II)